MNFFECIIYGVVSGLTEIFPVSSQANQMVMRHLFGVPQKEPIRDLLVHIAIVLAIIAASWLAIVEKRKRQMTER